MRAIAEAPSKAILTGEHFVVHGAWALACALPRKVRVEVEDSPRLRVASDRFRGESAPGLAPVAGVVRAMAREFSFQPRLRVSIHSEIPDGAGLGSSASTMVAVAAGVARFHLLDLKPPDIVRIAMLGEREIHGNPSGIDATVCALGGAMLFRPGSPPRNLGLGGRRSLIVAFSGKRRSTRRSPASEVTSSRAGA